MSVQPADENLEGYCNIEDVLDFFDRFEPGESDVPTNRIERQILAKSQRIDSYTGHAWRERKVKEEYKNLNNTYRWNSGMPIYTQKRDIRTPLDPEKGDAIELWDGSDYTDLVGEEEYSEGRNEDYWVEESTGVIYLYRRQILFSRYREVRVSYRYGKEIIPQSIREICAKLVAADMMETDFYRYTTPGNEEAPNAEAVAEGFREQAKNQLEPYKEVRGTGLE